jgi:uncharacterized damage-inducible protein DinB
MPTMDEVAALTREQKFARMARTADDLAAAIAGRSEAELAKRPDAKNWAAVECVCHLRDAEEGFMMRFQVIMAVDEPKLGAGDQERMAEDRQFLRNDAAKAIDSFRRRRNETLAFLKGLTPAQWQRAGQHPVRGRFTMEDFLTLMAWHDDNHLDQLERALEGRA